MPSTTRLPFLLLACAGLFACGSGTRPADHPDAITGAATAPLADLNLLRDKIPPALLAARAAPYAPPSPLDCPSIAVGVAALDDALGPDLDVPPAPAGSLRERGESAAGDAAVDALRRTAEGVLPFRGWVRKLSGAERHSREVAAAVAAGTIRRGYLKGLGQGMGCPRPAAPGTAATEPAR